MIAPISHAGTWPIRKAMKVLAVLREWTLPQGIDFHVIDVTTYADDFPKVLLSPYCVAHKDLALAPGCLACMAINVLR